MILDLIFYPFEMVGRSLGPLGFGCGIESSASGPQAG
jgi:hypothetical protein